MNIAFDSLTSFSILNEGWYRPYYIRFNRVGLEHKNEDIESIDVYLGTNLANGNGRSDFLFSQDGLDIVGVKSLEYALRFHNIDIYFLSYTESPVLKQLELIRCLSNLKTKFIVVYKTGTEADQIYKYADAVMALSPEDFSEMGHINKTHIIKHYNSLDNGQKIILNGKLIKYISENYPTVDRQGEKSLKIAFYIENSHELPEFALKILDNLKNSKYDIFTNIPIGTPAEYDDAGNVYYLTDLLTSHRDYAFVFSIFEGNGNRNILSDICSRYNTVIVTDCYDDKLRILYYRASAILCIDDIYPKFMAKMPYSTCIYFLLSDDFIKVVNKVCCALERLVSPLPFTMSQLFQNNLAAAFKNAPKLVGAHMTEEQLIIADLIYRISHMNVRLEDKSKLRILFDLTPLSFINKGGASRAGIYLTILRILIMMLKNPNLDVYVYCRDSDRRCVEDNNLVDDLPIELKYSLRHFTDINLPFLEKVQYFDILFCPMNAAPKIFCDILSLKKFTLLFDTVPLLYPEWYPFAKKEESFVYEITQKVDNDSFYIAISESTKKDYLSFSPNMRKENIFVVPLAASNLFYHVEDYSKIEQMKIKYGIPFGKKYLFSLCTIEPRKNLLFAIECFLDFINKNNIDDLVFVLGGEKWDSFAQHFNEKFGNIIKFNDEIIKTGYIDDSDLAAMFSGALFFVYPSLYEGFGLHILEAMQCGCPVISSNVSSIPEIANEIGILVDPTSKSDIIDAMKQMYTDEIYRKNQALRGLEMSKKFSWKKTVDNIISVFHTVVKKNTNVVDSIYNKPTLFPKKPHTIFTIVSKNYLGQALTLHQSLKEQANPNYNFIIFIMDMLLNEQEMQLIEKLNGNGVHISFFSEVKTTIHNVDYEEMLFKYDIIEMNTAIKPYVIEHLYNIGYDKVVYVDPDTYFYQPIDFLDKILDEYDIVLTPHMFEPYPNDGKDQVNQTIMQAGIFNCGFIATKRSSISRKMVSFWQESLFNFCFIKPEEGLFTDQAWAVWFPALYEKVCILRHRGHNAAYWNLHERKPYHKDGKWYMNEDELVFYHFSGFNPVNFYGISKYQNRYNIDNVGGDYRALATEYAKNLLANKFLKYKKFKYYYNYYPSLGTQIPSNEERRKYFCDIVRNKKINPFLNDKRTANLLIEYYHQIGKKEGLNSFGVNLVGYFEEMHSVGHIARLFANMVLMTGIPFTITDISSNKHEALSDENYQLRPYYSIHSQYGINILFVNADEVQRVMDLERYSYIGKYNIAFWAWEFETGFEKYKTSFNDLNEIIFCSEFPLNVFRQYAPPSCIVSKILAPFYHDWNELEDVNSVRKKYNIASSDILYLFTFDFNSSYNRKNPEATLKAFANALPSVPNAKLMIKTTNNGAYAHLVDKFKKLIDELALTANVVMVDEKMSRNQIISLINASDCYISLHRGEGFGLGMLEAMSLGKPVIASNYSGNTEFMNFENSLLVDCELVDCNDEFAHYNDVEKWAEPNIATAAEHIKKIYNDKKFAEQLGRKAESDVSQMFAKEAFMFSLYNLLKRASIS